MIHPIQIAAMAREVDNTGDFVLNEDEIVALIEVYGSTQYAKGEVSGYNRHQFRDHEMGQ